MSEILRSIIESYLGRGKPSGDHWLAFKCPFHKDGTEKNASFAINLLSGWSKCWSCDAGGPLDKLLKDLGTSDSEVAQVMADVKDDLQYARRESRFKRQTFGLAKDPFQAPIALPDEILSAYDGKLPHRLLSAGFDADWLRYFRVGVDDSNYRIVYPIRDLYGSLAGCVGGALYREQQPKYKVYEGDRVIQVPTGGTKKIVSDFGAWFTPTYPNYDFNNRTYIWHFDRVYPTLFHTGSGFLVIVEGYKACMWVCQSGVPTTGAVMGRNISPSQMDQLRRLSTTIPIVLFLDKNRAGLESTFYQGEQLHLTRGNVYVARYPEDWREQPDDLTADEVRYAVGYPEPYPTFRARALSTGVISTPQKDNHHVRFKPS